MYKFEFGELTCFHWRGSWSPCRIMIPLHKLWGKFLRLQVFLSLWKFAEAPTPSFPKKKIQNAPRWRAKGSELWRDRVKERRREVHWSGLPGGGGGGVKMLQPSEKQRRVGALSLEARRRQAAKGETARWRFRFQVVKINLAWQI